MQIFISSAWILNKLTNTVENILNHIPNPKTHPIQVPKSIKKEYGAFRKLISKANDNGYFMLMLPKLLDEIQSIEFVHQVYYDQIMEKIDQVSAFNFIKINALFLINLL